MNTKKEFIKLKIPGWRTFVRGALEDFLDYKRLEEWKKGKVKYPTFYESVIENLWPDDMDDAEANRKYYKTFTYNEEELDAVIEYTNAIKDWDDDVYDRAAEHRRVHGGNLDYTYLTDERLPEMLEGAKKLYDLMTENDEKYDFERSFEGSMTDPNWYDDD